jgi:hypothetical protein
LSADALIMPLEFEARSGDLSKTIAEIIEKLARMAGHGTAYDPNFCTGGGFNFQVLNANLVSICIPYGIAYHARLATRNTDTSV